jgi:hypothetical protein
MLGSIAFDAAKGEPVEPSTSTRALTSILSNPDHSKCPSGCLRPAGLCVEPGAGRLFMTGDSTGEIYVIARQAGNPTSTASGSIVSATGAPNAADRTGGQAAGLLCTLLAVFAAAFAMA